MIRRVNHEINRIYITSIVIDVWGKKNFKLCMIEIGDLFKLKLSI